MSTNVSVLVISAQSAVFWKGMSASRNKLGCIVVGKTFVFPLVDSMADGTFYRIHYWLLYIICHPKIWNSWERNVSWMHLLRKEIKMKFPIINNEKNTNKLNTFLTTWNFTDNRNRVFSLTFNENTRFNSQNNLIKI